MWADPDLVSAGPVWASAGPDFAIVFGTPENLSNVCVDMRHNIGLPMPGRSVVPSKKNVNIGPVDFPCFETTGGKSVIGPTVTLFSLDEATLVLGGKKLFANLSLGLTEGDRIGLIGPNGSGKTSMLRLLAGQLKLDGGRLDRQRNLRIGYLPQEIVLTGGRSLLQFVRETVPGRSELEARIEQLERQAGNLSEGEAGAAGDSTGESAESLSLAISSELVDLHGRLDHLEAEYGDHMAMRILAGLGFSPDERDRDLGELSGGWCMRALLGALLFMRPDLLLMDEPTNHLDMSSVGWLSGFLKNYGRAFILISHDREFLNEQVNRIWSFEPEGVRAYTGNYDKYLHARAEERVLLSNRAKNLQREREKAQEFINRFRAQANKARAVQSRIKALDKMEEVHVHDDHDVARFTFPPTSRTAKEVLRVEGLSKSYGSHSVLRNINLSATGGEKIGVIGVNGAGKTTLLKILAGELERDSGKLSFGAHVNAGYYAQHHTDILDPELTVLQSVTQIAGESSSNVRTLLGSLLFRGDDVKKRVAVLSGGERARVALARLFLSPHNLLLMDEPTNHLDLASSERLADALTTFDGTLVFVSHNRAFTRRLATRIWNVADGDISTYPGSLDEYLASAQSDLDNNNSVTNATRTSHKHRNDKAQRRVQAQERQAKAREENQLRQRQALERENQHRALLRRLRPLRERVEKLDADIAAMESEQKVRSDLLGDAGFFCTVEGDQVLADYTQAQERLERLRDRRRVSVRELEAATTSSGEVSG